MKTEAELLSFYSERLSPLFESLEQYRIAHVSKFRRYLVGAIPCSFLIFAGILTEMPLLMLFLCFPMLYCLGIAYQTFLKMSKHLKYHFKTQILPELLYFMFSDYEYIPNQRIAKSVLETSMLFSRHIAIVKGEDFMRFKIGATGIMFCEARALSNRERTIFNGIFICASFNKYFTSKTFVLPSRLSSFFNSIKKRLLYNFKNVQLEDIDFEREFQVLSSDQVEARYILTTSFMQRLLDYKLKVKKSISFSFVDNRLYCAIPNYRNLFEPAIFEPFDIELIKKNYFPIKLYTDLVDDLNLNLRIWSKQ